MQRTGSFKLRGSLAKLAGRDAGNCRGVVAGSAGNHGQALAYADRGADAVHRLFPATRRSRSTLSAPRRRWCWRQADRCCLAAAKRRPSRRHAFVHRPPRRRGDPGPGRRRPRAGRADPRPGEGDRPGRRRRAGQRDRRGVRVRRRRGRDRRSPAAAVAAFARSLELGEPQTVTSPSTIADGIAVKRPGNLTLALVRRWVEEVVAVDDDAIAEAMVFLVEYGKLVRRGRRRRGASERGPAPGRRGDDRCGPVGRQRRRTRLEEVLDRLRGIGHRAASLRSATTAGASSTSADHRPRRGNVLDIPTSGTRLAAARRPGSLPGRKPQERRGARFWRAPRRGPASASARTGPASDGLPAIPSGRPGTSISYSETRSLPMSSRRRRSAAGARSAGAPAAARGRSARSPRSRSR